VAHEIERLLDEIAMLKARERAVEALLAEKYKDLRALMDAQGYTKYEGDKVTARIKSPMKFKLKAGPEMLLEYVQDPLQFARVVLDITTIPQKMVRALKELGLPCEEIFSKEAGKGYLEVVVGKEHESRQAQVQAANEFREEVHQLQEEFEKSVSKMKGQVYHTSPVLPEVEEEDEDVH